MERVIAFRHVAGVAEQPGSGAFSAHPLDEILQQVHWRPVTRIRSLPQHIPLALIAFAMLLRVIVPAGWMPTTDADGAIRISICTGMGPETAYIDRDGKLHKEAPSGTHHDPQPCGFGVLALGLIDPPLPTLLLPFVAATTVELATSQTVSIGHGLAAPPPPSTGPPSLI